MYRLYAVWTQPNDPEAFEKHYVEVHVPLAAKIPGLVKLVTTRTTTVLGDEPSPYYRIAELWFEDEAACKRAMQSPELEVTAKDGAEMVERFQIRLDSIGGTPAESPLG
jgi:uncharacterized protein (TIGR02118 family)